MRIMASQPANPGLPLLYRDLVPLSSLEHRTWKIRPMQDINLIANVHAVPVTADEFPIVQRFFPIVFATGPDPVPLALMGLNEGANAFVKPDGTYADQTYLPAFVRRYPFLLAQLREGSDELSLCFDPSSGMLGEFDEGQALFDENGEPAAPVKDALSFCEQFEGAAQRSNAFGKELDQMGLLEEGEVTIQHPETNQPYTYRGFRMINQEKLRELRGDQLRKMNQNGAMLLIHAHLFSLNLMSEVFNKQLAQGKLPPPPQPGM
jgi:hypothetical protein